MHQIYASKKQKLEKRTFSSNVKRSFKPYSIPTQTFNNNVHNRTELLLKELAHKWYYKYLVIK